MTPKHDATRRKDINELRFRWHEMVIRDPEVRKRRNALALAGFILHRFHAGLGYAEFSDKFAGRELGIEPRSIARAKKFLVERGWLVLKEPYKPDPKRYRANRYVPGNGPDDLDLTAHGRRDETTGTDDTPPPPSSVSDTQ